MCGKLLFLVLPVSSGQPSCFGVKRASRGSTNTYKTWLNNIDGTYGGYLGTKVAAHCVATGWGVGVVQCIEVQSRTMTRTPAHDAIYPSNSQPFSIVWEDNTDSVVDLRTLNLYARNHEQGLHKAISDPSPASNGARAPPGAVVSNGAAAQPVTVVRELEYL